MYKMLFVRLSTYHLQIIKNNKNIKIIDTKFKIHKLLVLMNNFFVTFFIFKNC